MSRRTILIVDDEFGILETIRDLLEDEGYQTATAANGKNALALMEKDQPAVVILDYMMPLMNGRELVTAMKARPELKHVPVVLMSASPKDVWGDIPADAALNKPFELEDLLRVVQKLVGAP